MKFPVIFITGLFSFLLFDLNLFRKYGQHSFSYEPTHLVRSDQKEKLRKTQRQYKNRKYKQKTNYRNKKLKYTDSKSRDKRFTNQKSLRRMYRNG